MRIGINGLLLSSTAGYRQSGIDRYLRGLLSALPSALDSDDLIVFTGEGAIDPKGQFTIHPVPAFTTSRTLRIAWEQVGMPRAIKDERIDLFHGAAFALPGRLQPRGVVTVHDLAFLRWPDQVPKRRATYLSRAVRSAVERAARVIAVSEATRRDVIELLGVTPERIDVTPLGVDTRFRRPSSEELSRFRLENGLHRPYVLAVGTREPRKNLPALVQAFAQVKDSLPHILIHVGSPGWKPEALDRAVAEANLGDRLRFVDFVPHEELPLWYGAADCFVMPSLYEGFGLPLVEAMACGTATIASNTSSLPEIAGEAAFLCDPDADALANALLTLLGDNALRQRLQGAGKARASTFTWQRTAELTAASYRRAFDVS